MVDICRGIITEGKAVQMASTWNEKHCDERHAEIKSTMTELITAKNEHQERIAIMEAIAQKSDQLRWKILTPVMAFIGSVAAGMVLAYYLKS